MKKHLKGPSYRGPGVRTEPRTQAALLRKAEGSDARAETSCIRESGRYTTLRPLFELFNLVSTTLSQPLHLLVHLSRNFSLFGHIAIDLTWIATIPFLNGPNLK